jgi:hypothetical protein
MAAARAAHVATTSVATLAGRAEELEMQSGAGLKQGGEDEWALPQCCNGARIRTRRVEVGRGRWRAMADNAESAMACGDRAIAAQPRACVHAGRTCGHGSLWATGTRALPI